LHYRRSRKFKGATNGDLNDDCIASGHKVLIDSAIHVATHANFSRISLPRFPRQPKKAVGKLFYRLIEVTGECSLHVKLHAQHENKQPIAAETARKCSSTN
jgi:hypothetical protein